MKYIITNTRVLEVRQNEDGTLFITKDGENIIANIGAFIYNFGGREKVLERCIESDLPLAEFTATHDAEIKEAKAEYKRMCAERNEELKERAEVIYKREYEELLAKSNGVIPTTYENVCIVLRYLNTQNWGSWTLPKMSIGYACHQYDCDGRIATTMTLDREIVISHDYDRRYVDKLVIGAPGGHLTKYHNVR